MSVRKGVIVGAMLVAAGCAPGADEGASKSGVASLIEGHEDERYPDRDPQAPAEDPATIIGRLETGPGNQSVGRFQAFNMPMRGDEALLFDHHGALVATVDIDANGDFRFDDLAAMRGPFEVQVHQDGALAGRVIEMRSLDWGETRLIVPVSHETTAEARVFHHLKDDGIWIDPGVLTTRISSEMAQHCPTEVLASAVYQADLAFKTTLAGGDMFAAQQMLGVRFEALYALNNELYRTSDTAQRETAWERFHLAANTALLLELDDRTFLTAQLAASQAQTAHLELGACRTAGLAAASDTLRGATAADFEIVLDAPEADARLDATIVVHEDGIDGAADITDLMDTRRAFDANLRGEDSVLTELMPDPSDRSMPRAMEPRSRALGADLRTAINASLDREDSGAVIAQLVADFSTQLGEMEVDGDADVRNYLELALLIDEAHPVTIGELLPDGWQPPTERDDPDPDPDPNQPTVDGSIGDANCGHPGAAGLVNGGGLFAGLALAAEAQLLALTDNGEILLGAAAVVDGAFSITPDRASPAGALVVVALVDADGQIIGGRTLTSAVTADADITLLPIDPKSSLEARVVIELNRVNVDIDLCLLNSLIDASIATAVLAEVDVSAIVDAFIAAQTLAAAELDVSIAARVDACLADLAAKEALCADGQDIVEQCIDINFDARAAAAAAFAGMLSDAGDSLAATAGARARVEAGVALNCLLPIDISVDVDALLTATAEAANDGDLIAGAANLRAALMAAVDARVEALPLLSRAAARVQVALAISQAQDAELAAAAGLALAADADAAAAVLTSLDVALTGVLNLVLGLAIDADVAAEIGLIIESTSRALVAADL